MPRNVRNFWIELSVDGKQERVETGPRSKDGGFDLTIYQRDKGGIVTSLDIIGRCREDGTLMLRATAKPGTAGELDREIEVKTAR